MAEAPIQGLVAFDALLRPAGGVETPTVENIGAFYAPPESVEKCRKWFAERGILCAANRFGVSGQMSRAEFEEIFVVELIPATAPAAGMPVYRVEGQIQIPPELANEIDQVTVSGSPELF